MNRFHFSVFGKRLIICLVIASMMLGLLALTGCGSGASGGIEVVRDSGKESSHKKDDADSREEEPDDDDRETEVKPEPKPEPDAPYTPGPGAMMEGYADKLEAEYLFGNESYIMDQIVSVTFVDSLQDANATAWDVSALGDGSVLAWVEETGEVTDIYFKPLDARQDYPLMNLYIGAEGGVTAPVSTRLLFASFGKLKTVSFGRNFDTSHTTNMSLMFFDNIALQDIDLRSLDLRNVTTMQGMFQNAMLLPDADLSGMELPSLTNIQAMFRNCRHIAEANFSGAVMPACEQMGGVFIDCVMLQCADFTGVDTSSCVSMKNLFANCSKLEQVIGLEIPEDCITDGMYADTPLA